MNPQQFFDKYLEQLLSNLKGRNQGLIHGSLYTLGCVILASCNKLDLVNESSDDNEDIFLRLLKVNEDHKDQKSSNFVNFQ